MIKQTSVVVYILEEYEDSRYSTIQSIVRSNVFTTVEEAVSAVVGHYSKCNYPDILKYDLVSKTILDTISSASIDVIDQQLGA